MLTDITEKKYVLWCCRKELIFWLANLIRIWLVGMKQILKSPPPTGIQDNHYQTYDIYGRLIAVRLCTCPVPTTDLGYRFLYSVSWAGRPGGVLSSPGQTTADVLQIQFRKPSAKRRYVITLLFVYIAMEPSRPPLCAPRRLIRSLAGLVIFFYAAGYLIILLTKKLV